MTDSPTPQQVAEAKVEKVADTQWRVRAAAERWLRHDGVWSIWPLGGAYFPSESAARSALAAAQELAGVYARPEGRTCECVDLMLSEDVRKSQMVAVWPDGGIWHPINYDEWDRRYVWAFWERCRLCSRGVPKAPAAPGGEGKGEPQAAKCDHPMHGVVLSCCPKCQSIIDNDQLEKLRRDSRAMDVLKEALEKAADTFHETGLTMRMLGRVVVAQAMEIAETATRDALLAAEGTEVEEEPEPDEPRPIGRCKKCGTPVYSVEGFCGVCEPHKL